MIHHPKFHSNQNFLQILNVKKTEQKSPVKELPRQDSCIFIIEKTTLLHKYKVENQLRQFSVDFIYNFS